MLPMRDSLQIQRHTQTKGEGRGEIYLANGNEKKAKVAIFISDKIDFKSKILTIQRMLHNDKRIQQEDIKIVNTYEFNIGASQLIKKI